MDFFWLKNQLRFSYNDIIYIMMYIYIYNDVYIIYNIYIYMLLVINVIVQ